VTTEQEKVFKILLRVSVSIPGRGKMFLSSRELAVHLTG
jgi:hypothetical protein